MASIFPLKKILDSNSIRYLQEVIGVDTENPHLTNRSTHKFVGSTSLRMGSKQVIINNDNEAEQCITYDLLKYKKQLIMMNLAIVLDDAIDQMHILSRGRKSEKAMQKLNLTVEDRTAKSFHEDPIYDLETGDLYTVAFKNRKISKILEDCAMCKEILTVIKNEVRNERSYRGVRSIMQIIMNKKDAEAHLLKLEETNFKKMKEYKNLLITQGKDFQREMQKINEILAISEDEIQELLFGNLLRIRYITDWENSRQEQNSVLCQKAEEGLEKIIAYHGSEIEKEIRINSEIEAFLEENLLDMECQITYWVERYDKDIEKRNIEIQILRDRFEESEKKFIALQNLYALHKKQIEDFKEYKDKKKIKDEEDEKKRIAATKIQAWWRGTMVRRQLGPYNPNKKDKKGKGKNKKQKK